MPSIRNIIFDYGQVIINLDVKRTAFAFENAGVRNFSSIYSLIQQMPFFDSYDRGLISNEDFRNSIREYSQTKFTDEVFDNCWNAMLLDIPKHRLELLEQLKNSYNTFLLSNTNFIHQEAITKYLQSTYNVSGIEPYFKKVYFSCKVGMRKPEKEIFELVLKENNLMAEESLFIDDVEQNITVAQSLGFQTILIKHDEEVVDEVKGFLARK